MKVIDLINDIANGKEIPKKIIIDGSTYILDNGKELCYRYEGHSSTLCFDWYIEQRKLNEEVEIIEEDKEIEELDMCYSDELKEHIVQTHINSNHYKEIYNSRYDELIINKINELIKVVNELKKGK